MNAGAFLEFRTHRFELIILAHYDKLFQGGSEGPGGRSGRLQREAGGRDDVLVQRSSGWVKRYEYPLFLAHQNPVWETLRAEIPSIQNTGITRRVHQ